jgi:hypothetical protein
MMRKGPTLKATAKRRVSRGLMVVREARCVSLSPVSRLARIGQSDRPTRTPALAAWQSSAVAHPSARNARVPCLSSRVGVASARRAGERPAGRAKQAAGESGRQPSRRAKAGGRAACSWQGKGAATRGAGRVAPLYGDQCCGDGDALGGYPRAGGGGRRVSPGAARNGLGWCSGAVHEASALAESR